MLKRRYYVFTWDMDEQAFTPQRGVRAGPYSKWSLRRALRKLQDHGGYTARRGDNSVYIEAVDTLKASREE